MNAIREKVIKIGDRLVGHGHPIFIIAEVGVNHNQDLDIAKKLIDIAAEAGADAVKFQTCKSELLVTKTANQAEYQIKNTGKVESQLDMLKRLELPRQWHPILQEYCRERNLIFFSTPFSEDDADYLETINVPVYKIPSGEINNIPYLKHIAQKGKPMIVSSGMANIEEVKTAIKAIKQEGNNQIIVLHSTSNYPPSFGSLNLRAITTLWNELRNEDILVGYSDNGSEGIVADIVAAGLDSCVIEKHYTLDRNMPGPDQKASLEPEEFKLMVKSIRDVEIMMGDGIKKCTPEEESVMAVARKSIIAKCDIPAGKVILKEDLIMKRPGTGIPPTEIDSVVGKKARVNIPIDTVIKREDLYV